MLRTKNNNKIINIYYNNKSINYTINNNNSK